MARRAELRGIVNALNDSFISRNNDFNGFWAIGQLKLLAIHNNLTSMEFFLTPPKDSPYFDLGQYVVRHYAVRLRHLLKRQQIPELWISEASIRIDFDVDVNEDQLRECSTTGDAFQCCCQIIDDFGRCYSAVVYGRCQAHSSAKELKSNRKIIV